MMKYKEAFNNFLKKNDIFYDYYSAFNDKKSIEWRIRFSFDSLLQSPDNYINKAFKWNDFDAINWYEYSISWDKIFRSKGISDYYNKDLNKNIRVL